MPALITFIQHGIGSHSYCNEIRKRNKRHPSWKRRSKNVTHSRCESCSVVSDSLQPHGLYSPWNPPGQNTGVACHFLLQKIYPTQGLNPRLLHCRWILYHCAIQEMQEGKSSSSNTFQVSVLPLLVSHWPG